MKRCVTAFLLPIILAAQAGAGGKGVAAGPAAGTFAVENGAARCEVTVEDGKLTGDAIILPGGQRVETDAGFAIDIVWTGWRVPGRENNADVEVTLTGEDFTFVRAEEKRDGNGSKEIALYFGSERSTIDLCVRYLLAEGERVVRRKICLSDTTRGLHFLSRIHPLHAVVHGELETVNSGGFGQPVALEGAGHGAFFGLEYPASQNTVTGKDTDGVLVSCSEEMGERIGAAGVESDWAVWSVTPDRHVKKWFMEYVRSIRVCPVRPYTLYNTWYDVRSPEITEDPQTVMNEENLTRIISKFRRNMIEKHGIELDAFVLDDGWDVYRSDWVLRTDEFPGGLRPISDELARTGTALGVWFSPIGGYSNRDWRIGWMREHGYETVGTQLCIAGGKYSELFRKRVVDLVEREGVGYFKWDGIQFSCSEPGHGHPVGIYSRRAVLESVFGMCGAVRDVNPDVFLNITSGTWLSPWWVMYANTIWMDGYDYSWADVPSISRRDAAITYRDMVLYEDFSRKGLWFPIANLMTHGIIKGHLQRLGGEKEPLDKFTDNAILYFARGVSMWELYISPDILTDGEWNAIAAAYHWARDRFPVLERTEMVGGDPNRREPYGYVHFLGSKGIIAARNPYIVDGALRVKLCPGMGIDPDAESLVLERVYPTRWISPRLYAAGETVELGLGGYETAVYELYPIDEAAWPLPANVVFGASDVDGADCKMDLYEATGEVSFLDPEMVKSTVSGGVEADIGGMAAAEGPGEELVRKVSFETREGQSGASVEIGLEIGAAALGAKIAFLVETGPGDGKPVLPEVEMILDGGKPEVEVQGGDGPWAWHSTGLTEGGHDISLSVRPGEGAESWTGTVSAWIIAERKVEPVSVTVSMKNKIVLRPMPASPGPAGMRRGNVFLGTTR